MFPFNPLHVLIFFVLLCANITVQAKSLALSFDDGLNPAFNVQAEQINAQILKHLHDQQIKSIVFPSLIKIGDYQGKQLIQAWGQSSHLIGNHSALHQNLNKENVSAKDYIKSIEQADTVLKTLPNYTRIYRYPFLKEGNNAEKRDAVYQWLAQHQYRIGGVSIDASDWFYNQKYLDYAKQQDQDKLDRLKQAYIAHLLHRADYYDQLAQLTINPSPQHVLLLHVNAINAAFLKDVITAFQQRGWTFISAADALQDPLYTQHSQNIPAGESVIWSIAKTKGLEHLRYPAEDAPYEIDNLKQHGLQ
ncbi:polysaccharide deacetylase family protein [Acinetobacter sp. ANC 4945]|uniref:polysaccharide deacetylase family protein n=1 Tax=Acinetobacter amyesii TaxID=2942470 RepID=UPI000991C4D5|nr:polysaccharide deacetylase family protein [Acinetobacter amyesii]MCL6246638.1 polysaccharide deacetylase family protein [Acinetobacter amyesii]